ncbi:phosphoglycerate transporter [Microbacterium jejuense]|uniref:uridine kinase family protein n=1 Tax=Microbacterium jejuense TaxID=1263637 RepID=UPI0031E8DAC8
MDLDELTGLIESTARAASHPIVVGVSGFAGAGKSTLARALVERLDGAVRLRGDDFLDPTRSHRRSPDWDGVERDRVVAEVLGPFRSGRPGEFRRYDWAARGLGAPEPVPSGRILVLDLIGLFHPDTVPTLDLTVWCDVDLATAQRRGMARDAALGRAHSSLWNEVWVPNDRDFAARYTPRERADVLFTGGATGT